MIKMWKGIEKEGVKKEEEKMTLFVCADCEISASLVDYVMEFEHDIERVYFGAGREEFHGIQNFDTELLPYCAENNISIIIEVSPEKLKNFVSLYDDELVTFIVVLYDVTEPKNELYFKTDNWNTTKIFEARKYVDITCVRENMYPDDVVVFIKED